jgi:hypothetical protein
VRVESRTDVDDVIECLFDLLIALITHWMIGLVTSKPHCIEKGTIKAEAGTEFDGGRRVMKEIGCCVEEGIRGRGFWFHETIIERDGRGGEGKLIDDIG